MLVLFETAAGYAIFKLLDEKKLSEIDNLYKDFESPDKASEVVKLKMFKKFEDTTEALAAATAAIECKMSKSLKTILKKVASKELQEELAVADAKVGNMIQEKFDITCVCSPAIHELMRGIRTQMNSLITGLTTKETTAMSLGLAHSLSRYKLKFSPDKVDTMIVQAISLLDDLDKELNNYSMRCREWYGWHFPEIGKIVTDNLAYAKTVKTVGFKSKVAETDLSSILPEDVEEEVKAAAEISMGTEVSEEDIANVSYLCEQIIQISEYRMTLYDYLKNRMQAIAPNLAILVGELVGARLIAHAGSLLNLAKHPASTIQILGAEKALFRALKTKHDTPKYGLIYHASVVGQTSAKSKGKISRMLGAKSALAARYDALGEDVSTEMGIKHRAAVEARIRFLEEGGMTRISGTGKSASKQQKYEVKSEDISVYNTSMDTTIGKKRKAMEEDSDDDKEDVKPKKVKLEKVELKVGDEETTEQTPKKKKKKKSVVKEEIVEEESQEEKTEKRKVEATEEVVDVLEITEEEVKEEKPKKKKKKDKKKESEPVEVEAEKIEEEATEVATELTDSTKVTEEKTKKKKGKKRHSEADVEEKMEEEVIEVSSEVSEEATEEKPKKKKKERKSHSEADVKEKVEEEVTEISSEVTEELPIKKKKKDKKKKVEVVEKAEAVDALESVEPATIEEEVVEGGEKRKKKKKKSKSEV